MTIKELAEETRRKAEDGFNGALREAVTEAVGHSDWPGDVDPWTVMRYDEAIEAVIAQLIQNGLPRKGDRVRLARDVERYPYFIAREGSTGTVTEADDYLAVKLDEHLDGAEEWDNEVLWGDAEIGSVFADLGKVEVVA